MALDVEAAIVSGRWRRHIPGHADPAFRPHPPGDSRWQHGAVVDALYLAEDTDCMWAEWYRHLAKAGIPPSESLPRDVWDYEAAAITVADLSTRDRLDRVGLPLPSPRETDWPLFQEIGETLHEQGWPGILTVSAARPESQVLVVFLPSGEAPTELATVSFTHVDAAPTPPRGMRT